MLVSLLHSLYACNSSRDVLFHQIQLDKDQARILVNDLGYNEAAKRLNIKPSLLRQWAHRGKWNILPRTDSRVTLVTRKPADAHADALRDLERATKLGFAKYSAKVAKDSESASLRDSPYVHKAIQGAAIVHNWGANDKNPNAILNVAILTGQERPEKVVEGVEIVQPPQDTKQ